MTVVFIHHYGGNRSTSRRHQRLMRGLGFDVMAFELSHNEIPEWRGLRPKHLPLKKGGPIAAWVTELEAVLDRIPGPKIIFSFSFPSVTVPALLGQRPRSDVRAWICDGGPFLDMFQCQLNLFTHAQPTRGWRKVLLAAAAWLVMGGPLYAGRVRKWMKNLNPSLPILSFRAERDLLVPPLSVAKFFATNPELNVQVELLPEIGHLEGLKTNSGLYSARVAQFCAPFISKEDRIDGLP